MTSGLRRRCARSSGQVTGVFPLKKRDQFAALTQKTPFGRTRHCVCASLDRKLILQSALAFAGKSLYRTRRFDSLWASAAHTTHATNANSRRKNCGTGRLTGVLHGEFRQAEVEQENWAPDAQGKFTQTLCT